MTKKKNKNRGKIKAVILIVILAAISFLIYFSVREYQEASEAVGITVCKDDECIKSFHIHSDIAFDLCGNTITLPREGGELGGLHTHKEKNYLHFHERVGLDSETREQLFDQRLSLQEVLEMFEIRPEDYCTGEGPFEAVFKVNGVVQTSDYNWKDGDDIHLIMRQAQ